MIQRFWGACWLTTMVAVAACGGKSAAYIGADGVTPHESGREGPTTSNGAVAQITAVTPDASGGAGPASSSNTTSSAGSNAAIAASSSGGEHGVEAPAEPVQSADCGGSLEPELFAQTTAITGIQIALTPTDVYWNDGSAIMRKAKTSGAALKVLDVDNGWSVSVDDGHLYWWTSSNIVSTPLATPGATQLLAKNPEHVGWAVSGERVYYVTSESSAGGGGGAGPLDASSTLTGVSNLGGEPLVRLALPTSSSIGPLTADPSGVYWGYNSDNDPAAYAGSGGGPSIASSLKKFTFATGLIIDFAPATVVEHLLSTDDGSHVVWTDDTYPGPTNIWSSKPDGSERVAVASSPLIRGLAIDATTAYFAASSVGDASSDILAAPLAGGAVRTIVCHVQNVYGLRVDDTDVYYFTWTVSPIIGRVAKTPPH